MKNILFTLFAILILTDQSENPVGMLNLHC